MRTRADRTLVTLSLAVILSGQSPANAAATAQKPSNGLSYINPLIGTTNGGNVFAGATLPYGLAKASADVDGQNTGGFGLDGSNVVGFSSVHDSGTGGNPSLGNFPLFPQLCPDDGDINSCRFRVGDRKLHYVNDSVTARPGYFGLRLESGVAANMTVSQHAALYRFTFPQDSNRDKHPLILLDLTDLWQSRQNASIQVDERTGRMTGNGTFLPSFGAGSYVMHFCADFFGPEIHETGVWVNSRAGTDPKHVFLTRGFNLFYLEGGGFVRVKPPGEDGVVTVRMGISYISSEQACRSAEREIPSPLKDFDRLVGEAQRAWTEKLSPISVKSGGATEDLMTSFWSGVYRNMISPQNYTGENPLWKSDKPYFDSFYCIWDSFRVQHPLLTILDPHAQTQMVEALLDIYKHEGWMPDCRMSLCKGWTQGGSNADVVIADAFAKNLSTTIDWELALEAVMADAEHEPQEWSYHGRGGLHSWKKLEYIPYLDFDPYGFGTNSRSISRTLEYAYDDYCLSELAGGLGRRDLQTKYQRRSMNWKNLWKADQTSLINGTDTGFRGFFQPRYQNGSWGFQDPIACSALAGFCSLTTNPSETFEASIWQYLFYVPHSVSSLISLLGGDDAMISRLDFFHTSGLADISNEPVFFTVFLYHYTGRPGLSTKRIHQYVPADFNSSPGGLPGNDDSGAMGAFLVFSVMGLFPVAGQNVYLISPPFVEEINIRHPVTGKTATVRNIGFDASYEKIYVQSARVNGRPWTRSWIGHEFFTEGWTLELVLGAEESGWGRDVKDRPPSWSGDVI
ncbi:hypothetical protein MKX07_003470 [Trichoderma sp. CBMAI-0711]|uniref:GH92 alpha-1,2-mannosidase n=1 Tax=Trichoderma parareesei TaxID=858221 RepID=A0A2H2ZIJ3_TRIPA|nr:hypothetical protein MKX07_003470 [Trichoderma sp. CBMAI-0711]OTA00565.1 GH92 alpha-1,2-mannosidase [Trichoderma parareesei]